MGRLNEALNSWREHMFYAKEGADTLIRESARRSLSVDVQKMIEAFDDEFDEADQKAWRWLKENE